jgi:glycosyltransferase involved in cell wall biosynthesis
VLENTHPGINGNFNNAIAGCTGDYIFICDQDDRWAENKRSAVLETFEVEEARAKEDLEDFLQILRQTKAQAEGRKC